MNILIAGAGSIGTRHALNAQALGHTVVIADPKPSLITPPQTFMSVDEALTAGKYDAAIIASPSHLHADHAIKCLKAGLPILVEKPLCLQSEHAQALVELAGQTGLVAMMAQSYRYNHGILQLKALLDNRVLGEIDYCLYDSGESLESMYPGRDLATLYAAQKDQGGGVLWTNYSHLLDTLRFLFGEITHCHASQTHFSKNFVDVEMAVFANIKAGNVGVVAISEFYSHAPKHQIDIVAELGSIVVDMYSNSAVVCLRDGMHHSYQWPAGDPYLAELKDFLDAVENKKPSPVPLSEGAEVVRLIQEMQEAINA